MSVKECHKNLNYEYIDWENFSNVNIYENGICEGKKCPIIVTYKKKKYVLKEVNKRINYGIDYLVIDKCKQIFGLNDMNINIINSNKGLIKKNTKINKYANNCKIDNKNCIYCMMYYWDNIGDMRTYIDIADNDTIYQCIKIILFDGLFLSSDNIIRNILINQNHELLSIDEDDLFGKTKYIFGKSPWCKKEKFREMLYNIIKEFMDNKEIIKTKVNKIFIKYNLNYSDIFNYRIDNFKDIVEYEF